MDRLSSPASSRRPDRPSCRRPRAGQHQASARVAGCAPGSAAAAAADRLGLPAGPGHRVTHGPLCLSRYHHNKDRPSRTRRASFPRGREPPRTARRRHHGRRTERAPAAGDPRLRGDDSMRLAALLDIRHCSRKLVDHRLQVQADAGLASRRRLWSRGVGFPVELLAQEVEPPAHRAAAEPACARLGDVRGGGGGGGVQTVPVPRARRTWRPGSPPPAPGGPRNTPGSPSVSSASCSRGGRAGRRAGRRRSAEGLPPPAPSIRSSRPARTPASRAPSLRPCDDEGVEHALQRADHGRFQRRLGAVVESSHPPRSRRGSTAANRGRGPGRHRSPSSSRARAITWSSSSRLMR